MYACVRRAGGAGREVDRNPAALKALLQARRQPGRFGSARSRLGGRTSDFRTGQSGLSQTALLSRVKGSRRREHDFIETGDDHYQRAEHRAGGVGGVSANPAANGDVIVDARLRYENVSQDGQDANAVTLRTRRLRNAGLAWLATAGRDRSRRPSDR